MMSQETERHQTASPNEKLVPFSIDSEEALLGSLMLWARADEEPLVNFPIWKWLLPSDFFRDTNRWVYEAIISLIHEGMGIDQITVAYRLRDMEKLEKVGGAGFLLYCLQVIPTPYHIEYYARIIKECSERRQAITRAGKMAGEAYAGKLKRGPMEL